MIHSISPCYVFIPAMSAYSFTIHHLASRLPSILHASCMGSDQDQGECCSPCARHYSCFSCSDRCEDTSPIRGGDTWYSGAIVRDAHTKVGGDRGGADGSEREREIKRVNNADTKGVTLRARVISLEVVETWLHGIVKDERKARERIERPLGLV
ncbi:hypothetical protein Tco_1579995 [Tanacetum coccineum]